MRKYYWCTCADCVAKPRRVVDGILPGRRYASRTTPWRHSEEQEEPQPRDADGHLLLENGDVNVVVEDAPMGDLLGDVDDNAPVLDDGDDDGNITVAVHIFHRHKSYQLCTQ